MLKNIVFEGSVFQILPDETLATVLQRNNIQLALECGGRNRCGRCKIRLLSGIYRSDDGIFEVLPDSPVDKNACSLRLISASGHACRIPVRNLSPDIQPPEFPLLAKIKSSFQGTAIVIDAGTTTVAAVLLENGKIKRYAEEINAQTAEADNVVDRIARTASPGARKHIHQLLLQKTVEPLLDKLLIRGEKVEKIIVAGNSAMSCFFFNADSSSLGKAPYEPDKKEFSAPAGTLGLRNIPPEIPVTAVPGIAGFIGGDIAAGLTISGFGDPEKNELFIDLGTNCEMVLNVHGRYFASAAAAGPAFERGNLRSDLSGSIRHIQRKENRWQWEPELSQPNGFCATGLIDYLAQMRKYGYLNTCGQWQNKPELPENLTLSGGQIAELLTAKAAIASCLQLLMEAAAINITDLQTVYLAGNISMNLNLKNAKELHLLPELPDDAFCKLGNTALAGAAAIALDPQLECRASAWQHTVQHINPATIRHYQQYFTHHILLN